MSDVILELSGVSVRYGDFLVVHDVDLVVSKGEIVALLGLNGAGKSTLLQAISGVTPFQHGDIRYLGNPVAGRSAKALVHDGLRLVPEGRELFPSLTVHENLRVATFPFRRRPDVRDQIDWALSVFPALRPKSKQLAGTLSGGEQQMLALARAMMFDPQLLLIDEISLGLAPVVVDDLYETLTELVAASGISVVLVEQLFHVARGMAHSAHVMEVGYLKPIDLRLTSEAALLASYLGSS